MTSKIKYIHTEKLHNTTAASIIVPIALELISGITGKEQLKVVDFGCGLGTWLHVFKKHGASEILGLDGRWVNRKLLFKYIAEEEFREVNMEEPIKLDKTYDLVVSLEVAEHITEKNSDVFVQSLVNAGKLLLFSAAIPGQGGFNHYNEQWPSYWAEKFGKHEYVLHDIMRRKIWNNDSLETWYKQNMFIVAHKDIKVDARYPVPIDIVHPDIFKHINTVEKGKRGVSFYFILLCKSIRNRLKVLQENH